MSKIKEFNRSICFTFFEDHRITARELEKDCGKEIVADYYNAIADYSLYGIEPELYGALKYLWPTTKSALDKSIERRASGFSRENTEQTEQILAYQKEHPDATQREIAEATGISTGKVNKVLKNAAVSTAIPFADTVSTPFSDSNTTREREYEHASPSAAEEDAKKSEKTESFKTRGLEDLTDEELESIRADFSKRIDYKVTRERLGLNRQVSKEMQKEVDEILSQRKASSKNAEIEAQFSSMSTEDITRISDYLGCTNSEVKSNLSYLGVDAKYFLDWLVWEEGGHANTFRKDGEVWFNECENGNQQYKTYIDFLKMGIRANPVGVKHHWVW